MLFLCWPISARKGSPETVVPTISQETLAEMVGTTRSRVSFFMNRFRKLGFLEYGESGLQFIVRFECRPSRLVSTLGSFSGTAISNTRRLLDLVRRAALSSSPPTLPTMSPCRERFLRWRLVPLRRGGLLHQRVKTVTHVVQLLNFVQVRIRVHQICGFPRRLGRREALQMGST